MSEVAKIPLAVQYLEKYSAQVRAAMPTTVPLGIDRFKRTVINECRKNPALLRADPRNLLGAAVQAAQLGLELGNAQGLAYLVPFKKDVTLILGFRGLITLATRSDKVRSITPRGVFEGDAFSYELGLGERLIHRPGKNVDRTNPDTLTHVYAIAVLATGEKVFDVMTVAECNKIRARSPAARRGGSPWDTDYIPMCLKSVVRRLCKYLPASAELNAAVGLDEMADAGIPQDLGTIIDGEFETHDEPDEEQAEPTPAERVRSADPGPRHINEGLAATDPGYFRAPQASTFDSLMDRIRLTDRMGELERLNQEAVSTLGLTERERELINAAASEAYKRLSWRQESK